MTAVYPWPVVWVLVDLTALPAGRRKQLDDRHKLTVPHAAVSATPNVAGTQALIKVAGWSKADVPAHAAVLRVFDQSDHREAVVLIQTPEWRRDDEEELLR